MAPGGMCVAMYPPTVGWDIADIGRFIKPTDDEVGIGVGERADIPTWSKLKIENDQIVR